MSSSWIVPTRLLSPSVTGATTEYMVHIHNRPRNLQLHKQKVNTPKMRLDPMSIDNTILMEPVPIQLCFIQLDKTAYLTQFLYEDGKTDYTLEGPNIDIHHLMITTNGFSSLLDTITITKKQQENNDDVSIETQYCFSLPLPSMHFKRESYDTEQVAYLTAKTEEDTKPLIPPEIVKTIYDAEYTFIKEKLLLITVELTLFGSLLLSVFTTIEKGYAFALGGSLGYIYVALLEAGIDNVGKISMQRVLDQATRLGILFLLSAGIVIKYQKEITDDKVYFIVGVLGFMMCRLAFLITYLSSSHSQKDVSSSEDLSRENDT